MSTESAVAPQWVVVYLGRAVTHSSKEEAERLSTADRIALLPVAFDPKELSNHDLCLALEEMRRRGWAVAAYDVDDVDALISDDVDPAPTDEDIRTWLKDNQDDLQDGMCAAMQASINAEWNRSDEG